MEEAMKKQRPIAKRDDRVYQKIILPGFFLM